MGAVVLSLDEARARRRARLAPVTRAAPLAEVALFAEVTADPDADPGPVPRHISDEAVLAGEL